MLKSVLEASVRIGHSSTTASTPPEPGCIDTATGCARHGCVVVRVPKRTAICAARGIAGHLPHHGFLSFEHGNLDTSAGHAKPGKPPSPVMSRARGGASVVVGARESRAQGEGRQ